MNTLKRLDELDSLRGLAAVTVILHHLPHVLASVFTYSHSSPWVNLTVYSPLHILVAGHEAVILFFVLSGFVLALPGLQGIDSPYLPYLVRRVCRIYIPYLVTVACSIVLMKLLWKGPVDTLSDWYNRYWSHELSADLLVDHLLLIGTFSSGKVIPVVWSLVHEMRISLVFPFIVVLIRKFSWKVILPATLLLSSAGCALQSLTDSLFSVKTDYFLTLHYTAMFITGGLLAKHRADILGFIGRMASFKKVWLLPITGILTYTYAWWFFPSSLFKWASVIHTEFANDWVITSGACIFIIIALASKRAACLLLSRPIHFSGKISYSLYLYHTICLLAFTTLLHKSLPMTWIWLFTLAATLVVSALSYYYVELPSVRLGKLMTAPRPSRTQPGMTAI